MGNWQSPPDLSAALSGLLTSRSVIVCVGNELGSDDAAGPHVAVAIAGKVPWRVFDAQTVPENFLMKVVEAAPDVVLVIDALEFGGQPGQVRLIGSDEVSGQGPSTHGPAPIAFLDVLNMMHPCRRLVLGIQPKSVRFGETMCPEVEAGVQLVADILVAVGRDAAT